jgi:hypothetical protein
MNEVKPMKTRQFKKIAVLEPKAAPGGCTSGAGTDPDAAPC